MGSFNTIISIKDHSIILYDGECKLCNHAVQFIINRDKHNRFLFAPLQSPYGQEKLMKAGLNPSEFHSIILIHDNKLLQRSNAALEITIHLKGLWPALYFLKIIPRFIRDSMYDFISKNRYRFFGKADVCTILNEESNYKFIEGVEDL